MSAIHATDVMSVPVLAIRIDQTLDEAMSTFRALPHVHHLVVTEGTHIRGVLARGEVAEIMTPESGAFASGLTTIRSVLRSSALCVRGDASMPVVAEIMDRAGVDALPVIDASGAVQGIITVADVVRFVASEAVDPKESNHA